MKKKRILDPKTKNELAFIDYIFSMTDKTFKEVLIDIQKKKDKKSNNSLFKPK